MEGAEVESCVTEEDDCPNRTEVSCLMRVGRNSDWLHLFRNTEVPPVLTSVCLCNK